MDHINANSISLLTRLVLDQNSITRLNLMVDQRECLSGTLRYHTHYRSPCSLTELTFYMDKRLKHDLLFKFNKISLSALTSSHHVVVCGAHR